MSEDRKNLVDRVLGISSWKQAFITVMLGFFVLVAWLAYTNSARLVEVFEGFMQREA